MKKKTKQAVIAAALVLVLALGAFLCWKLLSPQAQAGSKSVNVEITHGDGAVKELTLRTDAEYLWDAMYAEGLIDGADGEFGKWVTTVDGETADEANGVYWMFTRGGEWVTTSCDTTPLLDGDGYEFFLYAYEG